jgi:polyhydroxyalkanoate synthesis repressor PhaR
MNENSERHLDIRKYPNRRYYDATRSRHLTLEEIRSLIREGYDIKVTDSKTGADITAQVLTQIVLEMETAKIDSFPVALLVQMIRANDHLVKDFVEKYFNQAFGAYLEYQKQLEHRMREIQRTAGAFAPFAAWPEGMVNPFMPVATPAGSSTPSAHPINEDAPGLRTIITELQQQVAGLKEQMNQSKRKSKKR